MNCQFPERTFKRSMKSQRLPPPHDEQEMQTCDLCADLTCYRYLKVSIIIFLQIAALSIEKIYANKRKEITVKKNRCKQFALAIARAINVIIWSYFGRKRLKLLPHLNTF